MELVKIITIAVSSSVLAAILTSVFNLIIQNRNYKRDYYKKIIEKRIDAQEQIIKLSTELKIMVHLDNGKLCNSVFTNGESHFDEFIILLASTVNQSFWLSEQLGEILLNLNISLLEEIRYKIQSKNKVERDNEIELLGIKNLEKFRGYRKQLERQILIDFADMDKVRSFINSKRKSKNKLYELRKDVNS